MKDDPVEEALQGDEPPFSETPDAALPEDAVQAMRYMRRLHKTRARIYETDAVFEAAIAEIEERRRAALDPMKAQEDWLVQALALWHHARLQEDATQTTIHLPTGTLTSKNADDRWAYDDQAAFLTWAKDNAQGAIRHPDPPGPQIAKNDAKKLLADAIEVKDDGSVVYKPTGEKIPGLRINPGGDFELRRFYYMKD